MSSVTRNCTRFGQTNGIADCNLFSAQSPPPIRQRHLNGSTKGLGICIDDRSSSAVKRTPLSFYWSRYAENSFLVVKYFRVALQRDENRWISLKYNVLI